MNKFWKSVNKLGQALSFRNIVSFSFACVAAISVFGTNLMLPDKDQMIIILTIVGISIAYASFFISNLEKIAEGENRKVMLKLSKTLLLSPIFPIFSIILAYSKADFHKFNTVIGWMVSILSLISILIFFFCFIKLLLILLESIFKKK